MKMHTFAYLEEEQEEVPPERSRMERTSCQSNASLDGDDLPHEDDLLCEIVPEKQRLERLNQIQKPFEDQGAEPYKAACDLLAKAFHVPISVVSLLYDEFQWFKAAVGLDISYTPRCFSFCTHTLKPRRPEVLYVSDALEDERFCDSPLVQGPPHIRFYCGVPLMTQDGVRLGALCVKDQQPRVMDRNAVQFQINIAELVVRELQQGATATKTSTELVPVQTPTEEAKIRRLPSMNMLRMQREEWFEQGEGVVVIDATEPEWDVMWTNPHWNDWSKRTGCLSHELWSVIKPMNGETGPEMQETIMKQIVSGGSETFFFLSRAALLDGNSSKVMSCTVQSSTQPISHLKNTIAIPDVVDSPSDADRIPFEGSKVIILFVQSTRKEDLPQEIVLPTAKSLPLKMDSMAKKGPVPTEAQDDKSATKTVGLRLPRLRASEKGVASREALGAVDSAAVQLAKTIEKNEVSVAAQGQSSMAAKLCSKFQSLDEEQTGKISRDVMVNIIAQISAEDKKHIHVAMIEKLIDAHGSTPDGLIQYKEFLEFIFS